MEFHINKNSTLPKLKMELIKDGRNDFHNFHEKIQNAVIYFSMTDVITGVKRIAKKIAGIEQMEPVNCVGDEFYLVYQFTTRDTSVAGRYVGQFEVEFLDGSGTLIVPIREELFINILDGSIKK
ncbi:MAG: hypothetical protein E6R13_02730 [Spirochaetes bacterium]|nr:MAG: hypothetical protein E6R13_02730 [Spirochaetota bacterium]